MNLMFGLDEKTGAAAGRHESMSDKEVQPAPVKPAATLADLQKIDIRVGTILAVEDVSGSEKLVRLIA